MIVLLGVEKEMYWEEITNRVKNGRIGAQQTWMCKLKVSKNLQVNL